MNIMTPETSKNFLVSSPSRMQGEQSDMFAIVRGLWKRKFLVILLAVLLAAPAVLVIKHLTPWYRAEAQIMVEDRRTKVILVPDVRTDRALQEDSILSEVQVLLSRDLAKAVINKLDLADDPEFNPPPQRPFIEIRPLLEKFINPIAAALSLPELKLSPPNASALEPGETQKQADLVDTFLGRLNAASAGHSRVIRIIFESTSPQTAARVVNTLAEEYLRSQTQTKVNAASAATAWIDSRLAFYRDKTEAIRREIVQIRRSNGLLQANRELTLTGQDAVTVSQQLVSAQANEIALKTRLASVRSAIEQGRADAVPEIVNSITVRELRQVEETIRSKLAGLQVQFGPGHPAVVMTQAQLDGAHRAVSREISRIVRSLTDDVEREQANVARLSAQLDNVKSNVSDQNDQAARLVTLDRQLSSYDAIYTMLLDRTKQTELQESTQQPDAWVVSHADAPLFPYFPKTGTLVALAALTSTLLGAAIVLVLSRKKETLDGVEQARIALGLDILGVVPQIRKFRRSTEKSQFYLMHDKRTPFADAMRNLHVRLGVSPTAMPKIVLFASALPGEGKTTTALAFAALLANVGRRVIVIDCDSHRPRVHEVLGAARSPGLTNYLDGVPWQTMVRSNPKIGFDAIAAGPSVSHPANLLGSARMKDLLNELAAHYDAIVIDSPPVLVVPDALVVAPLVGRTLFLVRWSKTPRAAAERAMQLLLEAGADSIGAVLSLVDLEKMGAERPEESYRREIARYHEVT